LWYCTPTVSPGTRTARTPATLTPLLLISIVHTCSAKQIGLECLQPEKELWPVSTPAEGPDHFVPSGRSDEQSSQEGRRAQTRYPVSGKVHVKTKGGDGQWAKLGDVSLTG